ncbi:tetratricopeptide repeat protein, partial [Candidatus Neomarinimicrobiota bacterium]
MFKWELLIILIVTSLCYPQNSITEYLQRGEQLLEQQQYEEALENFLRADKLNPSIKEAKARIGYLSLITKNYSLSKSYLEQAIQMDPINEGNYYNYTCLLSLQGDIQESLDMLEKTLRLGYLNFDWLESDSDLNNLRNDPKYKILLKKYNTNEFHAFFDNYNQGNQLINEEKFSESVEIFNRALEINNRFDFVDPKLIGNILFKCGISSRIALNDVQALYHFNKAIEILDEYNFYNEIVFNMSHWCNIIIDKNNLTIDKEFYMRLMYENTNNELRRARILNDIFELKSDMFDVVHSKELLDSARTHIDNIESDKDKMILLNIISYNYLILEDSTTVRNILNEIPQYLKAENDTLTGKTYTQLAQLYSLLKDWDQAISYKNKSISIYKKLKLNPEVLNANKDLSEIYYYQGLDYYNSKNYTKSIEAAKSALPIDHELTDTLRIYYDYDLILAALNQLDKIEDAEVYIDDILKINAVTNNIELKNEFTKLIVSFYSGIKNHNKALGFATNLLKIIEGSEFNRSPLHVELLENISFINDDNGDYREAMINRLYLDEILSDLGDSTKIVENLTNIGNLAIPDGSYKYSLEHFQKAFTYYKSKNDSVNCSNILNLASAPLFRMGQFDLALESCESALRYDSTYLNEIYNNMANIYLTIGKSDSALHYYTKTLEIEENSERINPTIHYNISTAYSSMGNFEEAHKYILTAIDICREFELKEEYKYYLSFLITSYLNINDYENAKKYAIEQNDLGMSNLSKDPFTIIASTWDIISENNKFGEYQKALKWCDLTIRLAKSRKLEPQLAKAYWKRGLTYYNLKKFKQSVSDYQKAIRIYEKLR